MDFAFGPNYTLGLKNKQNQIINIEKCFLMSDKCNAVLNRLRYFIQFKKLKAYREGNLRHVVIREGKNHPNCILNILTSDKEPFPLEELWEKSQDLVDGVLWSINPSPADRSYGETQKVYGQDSLLESLNGLQFKTPAQSFFQTNTHQAEQLLQVVQNFARSQGNETVLDLYSGTGSIGLSLARHAKQVIGIEEDTNAVAVSLDNARQNSLHNYAAIAGKAEDQLVNLSGHFEIVVLDPPRPGLHKRVVAKIGRARPKKIIYVSCNPESQLRDVLKLKEWGYTIEKCQPLDMFPHTPHIENVLLLNLEV
jgi:23S rRNA (uracil-5-)-methyltransferase RumA